MNAGISSDLKIEGVKFPASISVDLRARIGTAQSAALVVGFVALALTAVGALAKPGTVLLFLPVRFLFWLQLFLGCFLLTMIHYLTGGRWGFPTRRFLEAGFMVLPLLLLLFVPIFLGLHQLYPWARPAEVAADNILRQRHVI